MRTRLDTRALEAFVAVAEALNFRRAAEALHMSQPPLSRTIRSLEERLGPRLFTRSTTHVELTAAGRALLPRARRILSALEAAEKAVRAQAEGSSLRIGLTSAAHPTWFQNVPAALEAAFPHAHIGVRFASSPQLVRDVRTGRLDAALIALPTSADGLKLVELDRMATCVALSAGHRLASRRRLSLADLSQEPVFVFERARQPAFFDHCQEVFRRHAFSPRAVREPVDQHILLAEVAAGRALALLPTSFRRLRHTGVVYRSLAEGDELALCIGLATLPDSPWRDRLLRAIPAPA
ncbi:MAG TPA: LysR family transcriptional regulator [Burkholderiaceae bacterium]|nr:LysR family transcriptional regulator [Burkholderiaceae bacterium]